MTSVLLAPDGSVES
jgi:isocitrate dehydrogenase